jgi:hypothetical protein
MSASYKANSNMGDRIVLKSKVLIEQTSTVSYVLLIPYRTCLPIFA